MLGAGATDATARIASIGRAYLARLTAATHRQLPVEGAACRLLLLWKETPAVGTGEPACRSPQVDAVMPPIELSPPTDLEPGSLLSELESRQDDVIARLNDLENQLAEVLRGLGVEPVVDPDGDLI